MTRTKKILSVLILCLALTAALSLVVSAIETPPIGTGGSSSNTNPSDEALFEYTSYNRKSTVTGLKKSVSGALTIPATLGGYPVTAVGTNAFYGNTAITSVSMPDTVTTIGAYAFSGCQELTEVDLSAGLTSIGAEAFSGCSSLTEITLPATLTSVANYAFYNCASLVSIEGGGNVTFLGESAFFGTAWLENQPDGPVYFGRCLYLYKGTAPESFTVAEGTYTISSCAFQSNAGLVEIILPEGLVYIEDNAFLYCSNLESINLPASLAHLGTAGLCGTNLTNLTVAEENDDYYVSQGCLIYLPTETLVFAAAGALPSTDGAYVTIGQGAFSGRNDLINVVLPDFVTFVDNEAFAYCENLSSVTMTGVEEIGIFAFTGCDSLTTVTVGDCLNSVGYEAFDGTALTDVHYGGTAGKIASINVEEGNEAFTQATWHCAAAATGDLDGDGTKGSADAIYLLYNVLFGETRYPLDQACDFNKDGSKTSADAVYLLYHVLFGETRFPL